VPRAAIGVIAGVFVGVLFLASNVAALHDPRPHGVPIAISGAPANALPLPAGYTVTRVGNVDDAVQRREAYGGLDMEAGQIVVASANGFQASMTIEQALTEAAPKAGVARPQTVDAVPLQGGDPRGMSLQQIVLGTIIGGFMMGVLTAQLALGEPLWQRGIAYAGFGALFGLLGALVLDPLLGVLTGHFVVLWICIGVTALAIALPVGALARALGQLGLPLAALTFLIVGNPSAGASAPTEFLPAFYRAVGPWLPPNADTRVLLGSTYFDADVLGPALILAAWVLVPATVLFAVDRRRGSRRALAHDAARSAADRADREPAAAT
jgi:hypothetical protein